MKLNAITKLLFSCAICSGLSSVHATGMSEIKFEGQVTADVCGIAGDSRNQLIDLGSVSAQVMKGIGTKSPATAFQINLQGCDTTTMKNAVVTVTGAADPDVKDLLKIDTSDPAAAKGVAIGVYTEDGSPYKVGTAGAEIPLVNGSTSLKFKAGYQVTKEDVVNGDVVTPGVIAGKANATALFLVDYL